MRIACFTLGATHAGYSEYGMKPHFLDMFQQQFLGWLMVTMAVVLWLMFLKLYSKYYSSSQSSLHFRATEQSANWGFGGEARDYSGLSAPALRDYRDNERCVQPKELGKETQLLFPPKGSSSSRPIAIRHRFVIMCFVMIIYRCLLYIILRFVNLTKLNFRY